LQFRNQVSGGRALLLVQGYPFTGFLLLDEHDAMRLPPAQGLSMSAFSDWGLFWDLRLFGPEGEWHLWREDDGKWSGRLAKTTDPSWHDRIERTDVLWGLPDCEKEADGVTWTRYSEARGAAVWIPFENRARKLPARLRIWQRIGYQEGSGLAGVVDAMLREIESTENENA